MMIDSIKMMKSRWASVASILVMTASCTTPNPRSCVDGSCTDPAFPYCDADGSLAGAEKTCIAVACTPGEFIACQGSAALTCNAGGGDYDLIHCDRGCEAAAGGCHLCDPNQTACTNGNVSTCDASGKVVSSEACPLGCFEDKPRCREMVPSNNLGMYLDMVANPPDVELTSPRIDVYDGSVVVGAQMISIPSFVSTGPGNGNGIRVFVVNSLKLHSAEVSATSPGRLATYGLAFVARRGITIDGEINVQTAVGGAYRGCGPATPGHTYAETVSRWLSTGGGGGGNATIGGRGGNVGGGPGPAGDVVSGTATLVPLRGGCFGGVELGSSPGEYPNGGGAIQLSAHATIHLGGNINVRGAEGIFDYATEDQIHGAYIMGGGGAGGSVLIEAPLVVLEPDAKIDARGGNGHGCDMPTMYCGAAGMGATAQQAATDGMSTGYMSGANLTFEAGGGGGGLGRLRVNTADGNYTKANTTVEEAAVTTGTVQTR